MKVVLFCGGQGMRLRDYSEKVPKPMVPVGYRPILWHVMKYYAQYGHTDFILCLGYHADVIKRFFLNYEEAVSNDFVLSKGGREMRLLTSDIEDWTITFVDTGLHTGVGERLMKVREHLEGEEMFLANYADGVTDLDLDAHVAEFEATGKTGAMLAVRSPQSYHVIKFGEEGEATHMQPISEVDMWINGGYFVFRPEIFDYADPSFGPPTWDAMIKDDQLHFHRFEGFWSPMDTFKEKTELDAIWATGDVPWLRKSEE